MGICYQCGKTDETRPYGKDFQDICYPCGMLPENIDTTTANYLGLLTKASQEAETKGGKVYIGSESGPEAGGSA